ncbi:hypothetical protein [Ramlibacter montanisoli]|uniref:hypothetical protein n=1 Tax=Ramlibacter montanisoli TaxID=2732512 RepID=UPI001C0E9051|nr:hypothetical protein [Ramlibacter montanisoli]
MSDALRLARTAFPEREDLAEHAADQWARGLLRSLRGIVPAPARSEVARLARAQQQQAQALALLDDDALRARLRELAPAAVRERRRDDLTRVLLLVGEAARRVIGLLPHPRSCSAPA